MNIQLHTPADYARGNRLCHPGREVDHSPATSTEVKKIWIYTSTPIRLHGVVLN
jgi:hypothetical protein